MNICLARQDKTLHINTKKSYSNSRVSGSYHGFHVNAPFSSQFQVKARNTILPSNMLRKILNISTYMHFAVMFSITLCQIRTLSISVISCRFTCIILLYTSLKLEESYTISVNVIVQSQQYSVDARN